MTTTANEKKPVGILAYGSLISDPGKKFKKKRIGTIYDVDTQFKVEFARKSGTGGDTPGSITRGGAPTLVPFEGGKNVKGQVLVVDMCLLDAANELLSRETRREINTKLCDDDIILLDVEQIEWKAEHEKDGIVRVMKIRYEWPETVLVTWIDDNMKFVNINETKTRTELLACNAISSVYKASRRRDGITYLNDAIGNGIETVLSLTYRDEILNITKSKNLCQALFKARERKDDLGKFHKILRENKNLNGTELSELVSQVKKELGLLFS